MRYKRKSKLYQPEIPEKAFKPDPLIRVQDTENRPKKPKTYAKEKRICIDMFKRGYDASDIVAKTGMPHAHIKRWIEKQEKKDFSEFCKEMSEKPKGEKCELVG